MSISARNATWFLTHCVRWMRWIKKLNAHTAGAMRPIGSYLFLALVEVKGHPTVHLLKPHHPVEAEGFSFPVWKLKNMPNTVKEEF